MPAGGRRPHRRQNVDAMNPYIEAPSSIVGDAVARALAEDLTPLGDITSALLDPSLRTDARFIVREAGVIAGLACATEASARYVSRFGI